MKLVRARLSGVTPFEDVTISFVEDEAPRTLTVVFGGDRTGKSTLLAAIATTRPGFAVPPPPRRRVAPPLPPASAPWVACDWLLGEDDPERPHLLRVTSPTAPSLSETPEESAFRRKEQALFDKRAQEQGGFALVLVSGARWFSRTPNLLTQPERTVGRYDVRAVPVVEDAARADLTRETKQILSYAAIGGALERARVGDDARRGEGASATEIGKLEAWNEALEETLEVLLEPFDRRWEGVAPETLEPVFTDRRGRKSPFEELPRGARHLVSIGALTMRALASGDRREGRARAPLTHDTALRFREGVVLVDDIEVGQEVSLYRSLPQLLVRALPGVQWILSTAAPLVLSDCARGEMVALRRDEENVEIHEGDLALLH